MSKKLIEIPELHNNDYDFFDVLKGLCKVKTEKVQTQTEERADNQENQSNTSNQLITSENE